MPTYTIYPQSSDGNMRQDSTVYDDARAGLGTFATTSSTGVTITTGQSFVTPDYRIWQDFLSFDTSVIPDAETVISANLTMYVNTDASASHTFYVLQKDWGTTVSAIQPDATSGTLEHWFKADAMVGNGDVTSDGDSVSQWTDSNALGNATQGTGGNQPIYKTNQINSLPCVRFDGSDDWMSADNTSTATTQTRFIVAKATNTPVSQYLLDQGTGNRMAMYTTSSGIIQAQSHASTVSTANTWDADMTQWHIYAVQFNSTASKIWIDTTSRKLGSTGASSVANSTLWLGRYGGSNTGNWDGDIAEIITYSTVLSEADMRGVMTYLADKYGITNLGKTYSTSDWVDLTQPWYGDGSIPLANYYTTGTSETAYRFYNEYNGSGNWINKTGLTQLIMMPLRAFQGTAPTGNEYHIYYTLDQGAESTAPLLTVVTQDSPEPTVLMDVEPIELGNGIDNSTGIYVFQGHSTIKLNFPGEDNEHWGILD